MELRQLRCVEAVARHRHFTRAAEELCVAQSALSHQIRQLERELGTPLFERTSRRVSPTEAGQAIAARARRVQAELDGARQDIDEFRGVLRGRINIGPLLPAGDLDTPGLLARFSQAHPGVEVGLREGVAADQLRLVASDDLDAAFCLLSGAVPDDLAVERLSRDEVVAAFAPDRAPRDPHVGVGDLRQHGLVATRRGSSITAALEALFAEAGEPLHLALESGDPFLLRSLAARGFAAAILPRSLTSIEGPAIAVRSLHPAVHLPVALVWRRERNAPPAARAFIEFVRRENSYREMNTPASPSGAEHQGGSFVRLGALVPLTRPGWVEAGRHLLAGLDLAVHEVNDDGGIDGRPLELVVRDTAADPERAEAAVAELVSLGVAAVAGEYHSVAARAAAGRADALAVPFVCSSAVLDALTEEPTDWVARLAPAQSHGWRIYADFLLAADRRRIAVVTQPSVYWASGARVLRDHIAPRGGIVIELEANALTPQAICGALVDHGATALLLLVGHPEPAVQIVRAVRGDRRLAEILIGAPAGQPEFAEWAAVLGADGAGIPFLRYLPERLGPLGEGVGRALRERLGEAPSFVAFEGWDTVAVLADLLRSPGLDLRAIAEAWPRVAVEGTRGPIRFSRAQGLSVWQWAWAPIQVVDRDPGKPDRFRILHAA